ncbi:hypothetical protein O181_081235 [Austropuccinia psidii MF-1]|uniref:Uncharacterized protein n=1 Tax=Austropuccinia psidii MF-1 TaxID=1389203 RepID=A0A9Q3FPP8_9BASI|nr:hypothetical protein [Austropuccinia psidii MF-1]
MHNWHEGVLKHHFCFCWGYDLAFVKNAKNKSDISGSESDVMDMDNVEIFDEEESEDVKVFLPNQLKNNIQTRIQDVIVPNRVSSITSQVGSARNGELKVSKWRALFSVLFPVVVLDSFWEGKSSQRFLTNTESLIKCTAIVGAKSSTKEDAICFSQSYQSYQNTSNESFTNIKITPNHHYAMNLPEQLMKWGYQNSVVSALLEHYKSSKQTQSMVSNFFYQKLVYVD